MQKLFILILFFSIFLKFTAQEKTRFLLSLDRKSSLFNQAKINTWGVRIGYKYGCKVNYGLGVYTANNILLDYRLDENEFPNASTSLEGKLSYVTGFIEPIILSEKRKIFSIPISAGGGNLRVKYREINSSKRITLLNDFVPLVDVAGVFLFKAVPFIWIGGGIGYRHFFNKEDIVNQSFNSPYYMLKLKLGRPCKEAGSFYKWRKNLFKGKEKKEKNSK